MIIYRAERKNGHGPFEDDCLIFPNQEISNKFYTHLSGLPGYRGDRILSEKFPEYLPQDYNFGCVSQDQLLEWFGDFLDVLFDNGIGIYEMEVRNCVIGEKQVVFKRGDIISKRRIL